MIAALLILGYVAIGYSVVCFACWYDGEEIKDESEGRFMLFVTFGWPLLLLAAIFFGVMAISENGNFYKIVFWLPNLLARKTYIKVVK